MPGARATEEERREQVLEAALKVAGAETLGGLTIRRVAKQAGLSNGLVLFHFGSKELLLMSLLDRLLEQTLRETKQAMEDAAGGGPREVFRRFVGLEIERLPQEAGRVELFFDFWVMGTRHPEIRSRVRESLRDYRKLITEVTMRLVESDPEVFGGMSAAGMAAVAVSFIEGCALQAVIDPEAFDIALYIENVDSLLEAMYRGRA